MAYETYNPVSWSDGTPITSTRLQQMANNTDLVKTATDDYAQGIIIIRTNSNPYMGGQLGQSANIVNLNLTDIGGGINYSVSANPSRYIKITFVCPGIKIAQGSENEKYSFQLRYSDSGFSGGSGTLLQEWFFGVPGQDLLSKNSVTISGSDVLLDTSITPYTTDKQIGGGTYAFVTSSPANGMTSRSFGIWVTRTGSGDQASFDIINAGLGQYQMMAEDCGKIVGT